MSIAFLIALSIGQVDDFGTSAAVRRITDKEWSTFQERLVRRKSQLGRLSWEYRVIGRGFAVDQSDTIDVGEFFTTPEAVYYRLERNGDGKVHRNYSDRRFWYSFEAREVDDQRPALMRTTRQHFRLSKDPREPFGLYMETAPGFTAYELVLQSPSARCMIDEEKNEIVFVTGHPDPQVGWYYRVRFRAATDPVFVGYDSYSPKKSGGHALSSSVTNTEFIEVDGLAVPVRTEVRHGIGLPEDQVARIEMETSKVRLEANIPIGKIQALFKDPNTSWLDGDVMHRHVGLAERLVLAKTAEQRAADARKMLESVEAPSRPVAAAPRRSWFWYYCMAAGIAGLGLAWGARKRGIL